MWPLGVPLLFAALLVASRRGTEVGGARRDAASPPAAIQRDVRSAVLSRATGFLHAEYRPSLYYWELWELTRKLLLSGFVFLIPHTHTLLRLLLAILISMAHVVLLLVAKPFRQPSTFVLAVASGVALQARSPPHLPFISTSSPVIPHELP